MPVSRDRVAVFAPVWCSRRRSALDFLRGGVFVIVERCRWYVSCSIFLRHDHRSSYLCEPRDCSVGLTSGNWGNAWFLYVLK
jgi:hypothetical protein